MQNSKIHIQKINYERGVFILFIIIQMIIITLSLSKISKDHQKIIDLQEQIESCE